MSSGDSNPYSSPNAESKEIERTDRGIQTRLCVMMFLQYFVQGCYLPIASVYVQDALGFSEWQVGMFGSALAVGPIFAPFVLGQVVDRWFATQRVLAVCHFTAAILMFGVYASANYLPSDDGVFWQGSQITNHDVMVWTVISLGTIYSVLYVPTMMLTNSLAFHHLVRGEKEFPLVRLFGTIGFVVPAYLIEFWWLQGMETEQKDIARGVAFVLAAGMGIVMAAYSASLPHTPPKKQKDRKYAPGAVVALLGNRDFLVLVVISFFVAIVHKFYFVWNSPFLRSILDSGGWGAYEQSISSIGQICEVAVMAVLGFAIIRFGFKATMLTGTIAYAIRCLLFAAVFAFDVPFAGKMTIACLGQALHGFCFGCFLAAGYMYVDRVASADLRGSMQTIFGTCVLALGFFIGGFSSGWVGKSFTTLPDEPTIRDQLGVTSSTGLVPFVDKKTKLEKVRDWPGIWLTCAALAVICVVAFAVLFPASPKNFNTQLGQAGSEPKRE